MSSLIVLKPQNQNIGKGGRTGRWGKGRKTSRRRKNKSRNPRKEKGTTGAGRPKSQWEGKSRKVGEHDPGEESVERMGLAAALRRTMDRAPRGRGPHPSRG